MKGNLDRVIGSSDPAVIQTHLIAVQDDLDLMLEKIPESVGPNGEAVSQNPVWLFATPSTDFLTIQTDIDTLFTSIQQISAIPRDSSAYHTGMMDINGRALLLQSNISDATPYMYVSITNILLATVWIAIILGIFAALKRKKEQLNRMDEVGI